MTFPSDNRLPTSIEQYLTIGVHDLTPNDHVTLDKIDRLMAGSNKYRQETRDYFRGWLAVEKAEIYENQGELYTAARKLSSGQAKIAASVSARKETQRPAEAILSYGVVALLGLKLANLRKPANERRAVARETATYLGQLVGFVYDSIGDKPYSAVKELRGVASELLIAGLLVDRFNEDNIAVYPNPASPRLERPHIIGRPYEAGDTRHGRDFTAITYKDGILDKSGLKRPVQVKTAYHEDEVESYDTSIAVICLSSHLHVTKQNEILEMAQALTVPRTERSLAQTRQLEIAQANIQYELEQSGE